jgi:2-oxoglutarate ferredoxin oxidoreductase subunit alpha
MAEAETYNISNCKIGIVSFGCTSRAIYEAVKNAEKEGIKVGYVRLKTIWPFPEKPVRQLTEAAEKVIVPEMNLKQVFYEVERVASDSAKVIPLNKVGGGELITPEELLEKIEENCKK